MNKYILIIFISLGASSCSLLKNNTIEIEKITNKNNIKTRVKELNISPNWLSINSKIKIEKEGQNTIVNANIRVKKDSVIWVSLKAPLGIEVLRTLITPDSIYFMSRMDKTYFIKPISHIKEVVKTSINFFQFQQILFSSPDISNRELKLSFNKEGKYILSSETTSYTISQIFRIDKMNVSTQDGHQLKINFNNHAYFEEVNSYYPQNLNIEVISSENFAASIDFSKIIFNKKSSLSFKIPDSYVKSD
ncbi:MAG: hypothetical protein CMD02_03355 [Flavobacteriales bacterium]|nr:hypothetical protein [Flavobacteriales bacterium]|tara:strand:+ start:20472 stop:21215 length:744 start_codon:yes stop_codon:yes gene_type:complete